MLECWIKWTLFRFNETVIPPIFTQADLIWLFVMFWVNRKARQGDLNSSGVDTFGIELYIYTHGQWTIFDCFLSHRTIGWLKSFWLSKLFNNERKVYVWRCGRVLCGTVEWGELRQNSDNRPIQASVNRNRSLYLLLM